LTNTNVAHECIRTISGLQCSDREVLACVL